MLETWAADEMRHLDLGDARLNRRVATLVEALAAKPSASVPEACGTWAATKGAYRLWDGPAGTAAAIRAAHVARTAERARAHGRVLVIQDTTDLDVTHHPKTSGVGPPDHPRHRGLKVHSGLAATPDGVPLGLVHQQVWARDPDDLGQRHQRRDRATAEKESQRWLDALVASQAAVPAAVRVLTVADREADIFDLFALPRRPGSELLIRATHDRRLVADAPDEAAAEAARLWATARAAPALGTLTIRGPRADDRPARAATLTLRVAAVAVAPPRHRRGRAKLAPVPLRAVLAAEEEAPAGGATPLCWLLLTTVPVDGFAAAVECVRWYKIRWLIERYHYVLKSGCHLEELRLETAARLECALATYCLVTWRLLWLTYAARHDPDAPCDGALAAHEWQALACTMLRTPVPPPEPPPLRQAVRWIAQLGGFLGRTHDGEPGGQTIWRGLRRLDGIAATWLLLHSPPPGPT